MFKKFFSVSMIAVLLITAISTSSVSASTTIKPINPLYETEVIKETDTYQKVKYTNTETGEVEYLEAILKEDGSKVYKATANGETKTIQNDGKDILVKDEEGKVENKVATKDLGKVENSEGEVGAQYFPNPGGVFQFYSSYKHSVDLYGSSISFIAGLIAAALGAGVIASALTSIATTALQEVLPHLYMKTTKYVDYTRKPLRTTWGYDTDYYRYYDYTNYAGTSWTTSTTYLTPGP
ncbi:hypothetical protein EQV77_04945 [Halobacillus fulvus]|nr:hypothetical protein EQV77_04945 [Halobacillus fulvus]